MPDIRPSSPAQRTMPNGGHPESWRARLDRFICSDPVQRFIIAVIVINAVILGLETLPTVMATAGGLIVTIDRIALGIFVVEIVLKLLAKDLRFFRSGWNCFDFVIVAIALAPSGGTLSVLRALRILRALRLLSMVPSMRRVVEAVTHAIPGMGSVVALLILMFYIASVLTTKLYGGDFPQWFGSIGESAYSLFQIMTLESWSMGIVRPVLVVHPYAWVFFVPFILCTSFVVLNLFIGIIVDAMQTIHENHAHVPQETAEPTPAMMMAELKALRAEVAALRAEPLRAVSVATETAGHKISMDTQGDSDFPRFKDRGKRSGGQ